MLALSNSNVKMFCEYFLFFIRILRKYAIVTEKDTQINELKAKLAAAGIELTNKKDQTIGISPIA